MRFCAMIIIAVLGLAAVFAGGAPENNALPEKYSLLGKRNIFSSARRTDSAVKIPQDQPTQAEKPDPLKSWVLRGCMIDGEAASALFENVLTYQSYTFAVGEIVAQHTIEKISIDGVVLQMDGESKTIFVGADLRGAPSAPSIKKTPPKSETPADTDGESILDRLRRRRQAQQGK